jgi:F0F1-type ATP synthase alpha subunit
LTPHEVGIITDVSTGIAKVSGLPGAGFEELLAFPGGVFGIAFNVDEREIGVVCSANTRICKWAMKWSARAGLQTWLWAMGCSDGSSIRLASQSMAKGR